MYWLSTRSPHNLLDTPIDPRISDYLKANQGVDAGMLDLGMRLRNVHAMQRKLKLRPIATPGRRLEIGT